MTTSSYALTSKRRRIRRCMLWLLVATFVAVPALMLSFMIEEYASNPQHTMETLSLNAVNTTQHGVTFISNDVRLNEDTSEYEDEDDVETLENEFEDLSSVCPQDIIVTHASVKEIEARRLQEVRTKLASLLPLNTPILIPSAPHTSRPESDNETEGWRQVSNILYVMGSFYMAESVVVVCNCGVSTANSTVKVEVYISTPKEREMIFYGGVPNLKAIAAEYQVDAYKLEDFRKRYAEYFSKDVDAKRQTFKTTVETTDYLYKLLGEDLRVETSEHLADTFRVARFEKTPPEIKFLEHASSISAWVHSQMSRHIVQDNQVDEARLYAEFHRLSALCGALVQSYPPIIASGNHSAVLHYRTGQYTDSYSPIADNSLIIIDAACEVEGHASDLTRTYIRPGTDVNAMDNRLSVVIKIVQHSHDNGIYALHNGVRWSDIQYASWSKLVIGLMKHGFYKQDVPFDLLMHLGAWSVFCPHGLGHPVGLDVHDLPIPKPLRIPKENGNLTYSQMISNTNEFVDNTLMKTYSDYTIDYYLKAGHVTTIEPGVYFIKEYLRSVKDSLPESIPQGKDGINAFLNDANNDQKSKLAMVVNWDVVEEYMDIGGVRIEDVILIEEDRIRILT